MKVDCHEVISIKVGRFILSKGFDLASCTGLASSLVETCSLGILRKNPNAKPRKHLFGLITREPRREFLGTVWFRNKSRGASKRKWVFEVYGRKYAKSLRKLAKEMASAFNVKITLRVVCEQPDVEHYLSDNDM